MLLMSILPEPPVGTPSQLAQGGLIFFTTWISRIGALIAFIGAIKFALSIKNEDAQEQLRSVMIMVSGFMIVSAIRDLTVFNIPSTYSAAAADAEFSAILGFIGKWTRRVGAIALFIGAVMFGLSIKDSNAVGKVNSLRTISAGGLAMAVSALLPTFAYI